MSKWILIVCVLFLTSCSVFKSEYVGRKEIKEIKIHYGFLDDFSEIYFTDGSMIVKSTRFSCPSIIVDIYTDLNGYTIKPVMEGNKNGK